MNATLWRDSCLDVWPIAGASVSEAARRERSYVGVGDFLFETRDDLVEAAHEVLLLCASLLQLLLVLV